jgi:hypothetical protein
VSEGEISLRKPKIERKMAMKKKRNLRIWSLLTAMLMLGGMAAVFTGCDLLTSPFGETEEDTVIDTPTEAPTEEETPEETQPPVVATRGLSLSHHFGGEAQVGIYTGNSERVVIPPVWEGMPVTVIAYGAFSRDAISSHTRVNDQITAVTLPDTLVHIEKHAFLRCRNLKSIHIPASVTDIDPTAFQECTGLESITVDEGNPVYRSEGNCLIEIATGTVVVGCASSVIPDDGSVKAIGRWAFYKCVDLTRIHIPASVAELPQEAFSGCASLERVEGCEGLVTVGEDAFHGCGLLMDFPFPETLKAIEDRAFAGCETLSRVTLPDGLVKLGSEAFSGCIRLFSIELPPVLEYVGYEAFRGTQIKSITVPEGYTVVNNLVQSMRSLESIYLPSTLKKLLDTEFSFCYELKDIHFNGTLEQWLAIVEKDQVWMGFVDEWTLHCTDGVTRWKYVRGSGMKQIQ